MQAWTVTANGDPNRRVSVVTPPTLVPLPGAVASRWLPRGSTSPTSSSARAATRSAPRSRSRRAWELAWTVAAGRRRRHPRKRPRDRVVALTHRVTFGPRGAALSARVGGADPAHDVVHRRRRPPDQLRHRLVRAARPRRARGRRVAPRARGRGWRGLRRDPARMRGRRARGRDGRWRREGRVVPRARRGARGRLTRTG